MNFKKWTTALMLALAVSSCIQDEALNSEAAIPVSRMMQSERV